MIIFHGQVPQGHLPLQPQVQCEKCETPHVKEEVKAAFVSEYNQLVTEKKESGKQK